MNHARPKPGALSALATPASPASPKACQDPSTSIHGLTVLREAGPRNIFFSYDGEGQILPYLKFARRMPPEFSLYAISPQRLPNIPQVHTTVEDMARHCVSILRKKQAQGPYLVGGLCAGGVIAFEMARQLEEAGDKVDWVVMFDTLNPQTPYRPFLVTRQRVKGLLRIKQGSRPMGAKPSQPESEATVMGARGSMRPPSGFGTISSLVGKARSLVHYEIEKKVKDASVATRIRLLRHLMQTDGEWPAAVTPLGELDIFSKVGLEYHPGTLNANLALVRAHLEIEGMDPPAIHYVKEPLLGWEGHTKGKLVVIDSAGGHTSMLLEEPWFEELADSLGKLL